MSKQEETLLVKKSSVSSEIRNAKWCTLTESKIVMQMENMTFISYRELSICARDWFNRVYTISTLNKYVTKY